jgi:hypothetical protein
MPRNVGRPTLAQGNSPLSARRGRLAGLLFNAIITASINIRRILGVRGTDPVVTGTEYRSWPYQLGGQP